MTPTGQEWSFSEYNEHLKEILETGKWWMYPWWLEDQFYIGGSYEKTEVEENFGELQKVFDEKWFLNQVKETISSGNKRISKDNRIPADFIAKLNKVSDTYEKFAMYRALIPIHPLFDEFHGSRRGALPLSHLIDLGRDLRDIRKKIDPKINELLRRLKDKNQYLGARFELFVIAHLLRIGWTITLDPPSTNGKKKADIQAEKGSETVFIELKRFESSRSNKDILAFEDWIRDYILRFAGMISAVLDLKLLPDCIENARIRSKTVNIKVWKNIADEIILHIKKNLQEQKWGHHVVSHIAEYAIQPLSQGHIVGIRSFSGFTIDQEAESEKIIQTAIDEAAGQLPENRPGIMIVDTPFPIDESKVRDNLSSVPHPDQIKHLISVILVFGFTVMPGQARYRVSLVNNAKSAYRTEDFTVIQDILSLGSNDLEDAFISALQNGTQFDPLLPPEDL